MREAPSTQNRKAQLRGHEEEQGATDSERPWKSRLSSEEESTTDTAGHRAFHDSCLSGINGAFGVRTDRACSFAFTDRAFLSVGRNFPLLNPSGAFLRRGWSHLHDARSHLLGCRLAVPSSASLVVLSPSTVGLPASRPPPTSTVPSGAGSSCVTAGNTAHFEVGWEGAS